MPATLKQLLEVRSRLVEEVRAYLDAVASRAAELPAYYPSHLRAEAGETRFDAFRQRVQVVEDRAAFEHWLAKELERQRAAGQEVERLAYEPTRARPEMVQREGELRQTERPTPPPPVAWDEQAGERFKRAVILGDTGFGKTWLLRYEARRLAREGVHQLREQRISLDELTLPFFARLSSVSAWFRDERKGEYPPEVARIEDPLARALVALVGTGRAKAFRRFVRKKLETDRCVILLDGWDEVPVEVPKEGQPLIYVPGFRQHLGERLKDFAWQFSKPRLLMTSRIVGYMFSPIPEAKELELIAFDTPQIESFVGVWFGSDTEKGNQFLAMLRQNLQVHGLARIPLMLALMCRAYQKQQLAFLPRRVELYDRCLRGLLRDWKEEKHYSVNDADMEAMLELLQAVGYTLFVEGYEQFSESLVRQKIGTWLEGLKRTHELYDHKPASLIAELKRDGIFIKAGEHRDAPLLFLHRTFHEYLTACALAQQAECEGWGAIAGFIDKKTWLPEWQEVIVLLAGKLSDPAPLLQLVADERQDDYFRHRLALAARCLPELDSARRAQCCRLVDDLTTAAFSLLWGWQYGLNCTVEAIPRHTSAPPVLPGVTRALSALGQVNGRMEGTPLLEWLCHQLHNTDQKVRAAAVRAIGVVGDVAATEPILTRLAELLDDKRVRAATVCAVGVLEGAAIGAVAESFLTRLTERLDDENILVRKAAAEFIGKLGSTALTNKDTLTRLAELLDNKNWCVRAVAARAVAVLGGVAATEPMVTRLAKQLDDADERVRAAAEPILTHLAALLDDKGVRAAVVWAVERLGGAAATESFLTRLAELLDDKNRLVRAAAIRAVGALGGAAVTGPAGSRILARLAELLNDAQVRETAAEAVRRLGSASATEPTILTGLAGLLKDENERMRAAAVRAVESLGGAAATESFLRRLIEQLSDVEWWAQEAAAEAVRALGSAALTHKDILPRLAELLEDENERVRRAAVRAVGALGDMTAIESVLKRLAEHLSDKTWTTGMAQAVEDVERLGNAAATERFLTHLAELLEDEDRNVQLAAVCAVRALGSAAVTHKDILPRLAKLVDDEDWTVQKEAAQAVSALGGMVASKSLSESFLPRLVKRLYSENFLVRTEAVELIGKLGSAALTNKDILPRLLELLDDENDWVREAAAEAVEALGGGAATESFLTHLAKRLEDKDRAVRMAAVKAVRALGSAALTNEDILPRLAERLDNKDWLVRAAAVGAVEALGGGAATESILTRLAELLDDKDPVVPQAAAKALERFMAQGVRIFKGRGSKWEGRTVEELSR